MIHGCHGFWGVEWQLRVLQCWIQRTLNPLRTPVSAEHAKLPLYGNDLFPLIRRGVRVTTYILGGPLYLFYIHTIGIQIQFFWKLLEFKMCYISLVKLIWVCMKSFNFIILMKCILITLFTKTRIIDDNLLFSF